MFPKIIPKVAYQIIVCLTIAALLFTIVHWQLNFSGLFAIIAKALAGKTGQYNILIAWLITFVTLLLGLTPFFLLLRAFTQQMPPLADSFRRPFDSQFSFFDSSKDRNNIENLDLQGLELASPSSRIWCFIIDRLILVFGIIIFAGLAVPLVDYGRVHFNKQAFSFLVVIISVIVTLIASYAYFRDSFNGQSIGRRILKIQVVDMKTKLPIGAWQCLKREMFLHILLPIELKMLFNETQQRRGDHWAKTIVINKQD